MTFLYFSRNYFSHIYHFSLSLFYLWDWVIVWRLNVSDDWGSDVSLFLEFINIVSILFYNFIEFIIWLYTFLVISFALHKKYKISLISISKLSDVLPAFTYGRAIDNFWNICLGINILSHARSKRAKSKGCPLPFAAYIENILLLEALRLNSWSS